MNIMDAVRTGRPVRRKPWVNPNFFSSIDVIVLDELDILADDWEVQEEEHIIINDDNSAILEMEYTPMRGLYFRSSKEGVYLDDINIDILLDFIYNNNGIGKKRIMPL